MKGIHKYFSALLICLFAGGTLLLFSIIGNRMVTVFSETRQISGRKTIIIDAGHGGVDGGATSCTGVLESNINLEIALRLNDLMHLLGMKTTMIRTTDRSIYTEGETIAAKKVSDLKERVRIVDKTDNAVLISLHQNYFSDSRYYGAQTFYADTDGSKELACELQAKIAETLTPGNKRMAKNTVKYTASFVIRITPHSKNTVCPEWKNQFKREANANKNNTAFTDLSNFPIGTPETVAITRKVSAHAPSA